MLKTISLRSSASLEYWLVTDSHIVIAYTGTMLCICIAYESGGKQEAQPSLIDIRNALYQLKCCPHVLFYKECKQIAC